MTTNPLDERLAMARDQVNEARIIIGSTIPWLRIVVEDSSDKYAKIGARDQLRAMERALALLTDALDFARLAARDAAERQRQEDLAWLMETKVVDRWSALARRPLVTDETEEERC